MTAAKSESAKSESAKSESAKSESAKSEAAKASEIAKLPFETALAELESIVDALEKGAVSLDESIRLYERGEALKSHCDALLKNAEMRIEKIALSADGKPQGVAPLDSD